VLGLRVFDARGHLIYQSQILEEFPFQHWAELQKVLHDHRPAQMHRTFGKEVATGFVFPLFHPPGTLVGAVQVLQLESYMREDARAMLGFIILAGVVVNNAILLVDVALQRMQAGADPKSAMLTSATTRLRPIAMTAVAAVIGLLPLVVSSGAGSELYRGLGAVMVGGLSMSTFFTLVLIPILFTLWFDVKERLAQAAARIWNGRLRSVAPGAADD